MLFDFSSLPGWQRAVLAGYSVVLALAALRHLIFWLAMRKVRSLRPDGPKMNGADLPLVSVLVPAKDEEHCIERCVRSLLQQDYPNFEVIVIDDRSGDRTAPIVETIAREDGRVRLCRVEHLPPGWTGKTHALHAGQQQARGQWLLFVDADTRLHPAGLSVVLRDAVDHQVGMESLLPGLDMVTWWEKIIQPFAGLSLMFFFPLPKVNRPKHVEKGFANGQFILVSRTSYDAIGGHEAVRDKFVEDIHLGRRARMQGQGLRVCLGHEILQVRMYSSLREIIRGWSRIFYSAVDFRPAKLWILFASITVFSVLSYAVLILTGSLLIAGVSTPFVYTLLTMGIIHQALQTTLMVKIYTLSGSKRRYVLLRIIAVFVLLYILLRTIRMCKTHQVVWRGTTYDKGIQAAG